MVVEKLILIQQLTSQTLETFENMLTLKAVCDVFAMLSLKTISAFKTANSFDFEVKRQSMINQNSNHWDSSIRTCELFEKVFLRR